MLWTPYLLGLFSFVCAFTPALSTEIGVLNATHPEPLSVHILDSLTGGNAPNITTHLYKNVEGNFVHVTTQRTDINGRVLDLLSFEELFVGQYRVVMEIGEYFDTQNIQHYLPLVQITFEVRDPRLDYHVPLILSPFSYYTYRGG